MKRWIGIGLVLMLFIIGLPPAAAGEPQEAPSVFYDGTVVSFSYGLISLDHIAAAALNDIAAVIGAKCTYDRSSCSVTVRFGVHCLRMTENALSAWSDGEPFLLRMKPFYRGGVLFVPVEDVMAALRIAYDADVSTQSIYLTRGACEDVLPQDVSVPILMYHAVSDDTWGSEELFVRPSSLAAQLLYLSENGYTTITFEDFPRLDEIEKPVMLTFDDGYRDNYTELFPLLQQFQAKATIFVITDAIGKDLYLTADMIREMADSGLVSIQSHTDTHPDLSVLNEEDTRRELKDSREKLLHITGRRPLALCYPMGRNSTLTQQIVPEYYVYGLKMTGGVYHTSDNPYKINRIYISRNTDLKAFAKKLDV